MFKQVLAGAVAMIGLASGSQMAAAQSYAHIDSLAVRLQRQARELEREFNAHYRHAAQFRHLMSDAREMAGRAAHIHEVAHHHGSPYHLREDLAALDRLFHHVEELVGEIEHAAYHGHGHIHGDTRHVRRMMRAMSDTLHHLQDDVNHLVEHDHGHGHGHGAGYGPVRRPGIVIGGGGIRIGFGF